MLQRIGFTDPPGKQGNSCETWLHSIATWFCFNRAAGLFRLFRTHTYGGRCAAHLRHEPLEIKVITLVDAPGQA